jgi:hypothetical protein
MAPASYRHHPSAMPTKSGKPARSTNPRASPGPATPARRTTPATPATLATPAAPATPATPATHDDPRFTGVLAAFAADPDLAAVADGYAANQIGGGPRRFGSRALKVDGKIFAMLSHGRFVVKLSAARVDALVAARHGEYFDPGHGRKMKQWLSITSPTLSWIELATEAYATGTAAAATGRRPSRRG